MLKYVKDGARDLLALTLPSSLIESIRQVSEDDFLASELSHRQRLPRLRQTPKQSASSSIAVARSQRRSLSPDSLVPPMDCSSENDSSNLSTASILPYEVLILIFQYLSAPDLFSVLAVCQQWRQVALLETRQIDLSDCFPPDCLGLGDDDYSSFEFVYRLFSMFPLISSLVVKDRFMRDRDLRVVTAGILAGKMAFNHPITDPLILDSEAYQSAEKAVQDRYIQLRGPQDSEKSTDKNNGSAASLRPISTAKASQKSIHSDLHEFSRSVGIFVLNPLARGRLRAAIMEVLERNLQQREIQERYWRSQNDISLMMADELSLCSGLNQNTATSDYVPTSLVPMTNYRFQDCCFANDWGAAMDINKLPMIGLAAAISAQGLRVDIEGSYGAPASSIKTMMAFCFGFHSVISLDLGFRHTHMELEQATELLSGNPVLFNLNIVDTPAYHDLLRFPALRGLGGIFERIMAACLDANEFALEEHLRSAATVLQGLQNDFDVEVAELQAAQKLNCGTKGQQTPFKPSAGTNSTQPSHTTTGTNDLSKPTESLASQLTFDPAASWSSRLRAAYVLLNGTLQQGMSGLLNTRDQQSGQTPLSALAWTHSYSVLIAQAYRSSSSNLATDLPTPPPQQLSESPTLPFFSSSFHLKSGFASTALSFLSSSPQSQPQASSSAPNANAWGSSELQRREGVPAPPTSALSSLLSDISSLPATLSSALSFRRLSIPVSTLLIPNDSEDVGVGGGSPPTPDMDELDRNEETYDGETRTGEYLTVEDLSPSCRKDPTMTDTVFTGTEDSRDSEDSEDSEDCLTSKAFVIPELHPVAQGLRMAKTLLGLGASPNVYNRDGRSATVCASYKGFQPMEALLVEHGGYSKKELIRIRETM